MLPELLTQIRAEYPPLIAVALNVEKLGSFYIEQGANIFYAPKSDGGTALHWAAFCGKDKLVSRLIEAGAHINQLDTAYHSTPCGWAVHVLESEESDNTNQLSCVKLLLKAKACFTRHPSNIYRMQPMQTRN